MGDNAMKTEKRKIFLTVYGWTVKLCLAVLWAILVFAPEPVLARTELRIAASIVFALAMLYSWMKKTLWPDGRTSKTGKEIAAVMIAVLLLRLLWITFA